MRIGIVGTSHSQGVQPIANSDNFTKPLQSHLSVAMPEYTFYNVAAAGRGTERYLSCIVHLKQKYSVDAILLEYASNRTANSYWINETADTVSVDQLIENNKEYIGSINNINNTVRGIPERFSKREIKSWKSISEALFYESNGTRLQGINDLKQSWDLCELLALTVIPWEFTNYFINYRKNFLPFKSWMWTTGIPKEEWFCDGHHASDSMYELGAHEYFKPLIVDALHAN